ncbi:hypothetical protein FBU59_006201, partial [Linderina macrospora]
MVHISSFRVRLPCSDLEWDSMHAQPTTVSPNTSSATLGGSSQQSGLMVRTFREAVMHTSLSEQAANEIAATPSHDPNVYRYAAVLAGLLDSVVDFGDDIRTLASAPAMEGTELLAQLLAEQQDGEIPEYAPYSQGGSYGRYGPASASMASGAGSGRAGSMSDRKLPATALWLGSRKARNQFMRNSRSGWASASVSSAWPPDWRSRMRVVQERAAALERQFTDWYSSLPIAKYARKPYLYSQLPLQDRITYFHQQIMYYGGVIQLQSLVIMLQGLLLPDCVDEPGSTGFGFNSPGAADGDLGFGTGALTNILWRSLMEIESDGSPAGDGRGRRHMRESSEVFDSPYASRRRQFGGLHSSWSSSRRPYGAGAAGDAFGDGMDDDDVAGLAPMDE